MFWLALQEKDFRTALQVDYLAYCWFWLELCDVELVLMTSKIGCFIMEDCTFEAVYSFCVLEFL
jgi:hypothetical protein